jgi:hypothetical protein
MSRDYHHEETYTHKSGKKYNVRWYYDHDMGSPISEYGDCHGITERLDWNPTDEEQLEQHLLDNECELEEETRLRMMRQIQPASNRWDSGLYYDVLGSLHKARTAWGVEPDRCMEIVEKDFTYITGWYRDDWCWLTVGVAPLIIHDDGEEEIDEDHREFCGGYESTILDSDEDNTKWRDEVINDKILEVEWDIRRELHKDQLELEL